MTKIQRLDLLKSYDNVCTTPTVVREFGEELPNWIQVIKPKDEHKQKLLELQIDEGEASAICLALELSADLIILDDMKARKIADSLQLKIIGTLGIIVKGKISGDLDSIKPLLEKLQKTNFRISDELINKALELANE